MRHRAVLILTGVFSLNTPLLLGQHQTETLSPVITNGSLPYQIQITPYDLGDAPRPTLHSYAKAQWDGKWLLIGGRTNGLHAFTQNGFANFPPAEQNRDVWVFDPATGESWRRSLDDASAGLTAAEIDSLSVTNNQFYQADERLYLTGGYGYQTDFDFVTFDALSAIDVPGLMEWVQGSDGSAAAYIRQLHDPLFAVTGGAMYALGEQTHLVFGQDFQGEYTPFGNGVYTNQIRSFSISDDGHELSIQNASVSEPNDSFRRRDLNVVPVIRSEADGLTEELRVLSGVFTTSGGAWTVPVEINSEGVPSTADPEDEDTFKQAMNTYHSAKLGLYSEESDEMHTLLFGGISLSYFDREAGEMVRDDSLPFVNQVTSVVIDGDDSYTQYLLPEEFPEIYDEQSGNRLRFGTNAEFMLAEGISVYQNGVIQLDAIGEPAVLGYILGGIAADQPHRGNTAATGQIFQVLYTPVEAVQGDFDEDGLVNASDIDLMTQAMHRQPDLRFDLDRSGQVDAGDLNYLVDDVLQTWFGDANIDGEFNSTDLVLVFQAGEYEDGLPQNSQWATGDWNGDGEFDTSDFVVAFQDGGYERGPKTVAVPEPGCQMAFWCVIGLSFRSARFRGRAATEVHS